MSKKARIGDHFYKHGLRSGWTDYRYGATRPVTLPKVSIGTRIFPKERRHNISTLVMDLLREWRDHRWEGEATTRHGLRSALTMLGHDWHMSDAEAADIVRRAFNRLGRGVERRPTEEQGQPEHTAGRDYCLSCHGRLDEESGRDRFCSVECARMFSRRFATKWEGKQNEALKAANRVMMVAARPTLKCESCGEGFKARGSSTDQGRFCSYACSGLARRTLPEVRCAHPACKKLFRVRHATTTGYQRYCSNKCRLDDLQPLPKDIQKSCILCGETYMTSDPNSLYCCQSHNVRAYQYRSGRVVPKKLTPIVFDFFVTMPVNAQPRSMTTVWFDRMFEAA